MSSRGARVFEVTALAFIVFFGVLSWIVPTYANRLAASGVTRQSLSVTQKLIISVGDFAHGNFLIVLVCGVAVGAIAGFLVSAFGSKA